MYINGSLIPSNLHRSGKYIVTEKLLTRKYRDSERQMVLIDLLVITFESLKNSYIKTMSQCSTFCHFILIDRVHRNSKMIKIDK